MRKKILSAVLSIAMLCTALSACGGSTAKEGTKAPEQNSSEEKSSEEKVKADSELEGDITFWHSFTQGPRLETRTCFRKCAGYEHCAGRAGFRND